MGRMNSIRRKVEFAIEVVWAVVAILFFMWVGLIFVFGAYAVSMVLLRMGS